MYDWLLKKDNYEPKGGNDSFLSKNILTVIGILSSLRRRKNNDDTWIYKVSVPLKIIFTLVFVISLSLTRSFIYAASVNIYMLSFLFFINRYDRYRILRLFVSAVIFSLLIVAPSLFFYSSLHNALLLFLRITGSIICINVLVYSCLPHQITGCMNRWFVPDIFIMIFDLTLKYITLLGDCAIEMFQALMLRSVGTGRKRSKAIFAILGVMFLKSKMYSEELYNSMVCRCFDGSYPGSCRSRSRLGASDLYYVILSSMVLYLSLL
jgi:cobalt/nickel transport system permease protein